MEKAGLAQSKDSPSQRLGATENPTKERFVLQAHREFWSPLTAIQSVAELKAYHGQLSQLLGAEQPEPTYVASATMPGVDVVLTYIKGVLEKAVLRGDGRQGDDITDNVRTIGSVPLSLRTPGTITESRITKLTRQAMGPSTLSPVPVFPEELHIRCVVGMRTTDLTAMDRARVDAGDPPYIQARGAILGALRRLDPRMTANHLLRCFALSFDRALPGIESEWQMLGALKSWGFPVLPLTWRCKGLTEVLDFVSALQQLAPSFEYPLEGGMLTMNKTPILGPEQEHKSIPTSVRLIFPTPGRFARVSKVYYAVGRGGAVLPVALLERDPEHKLPVPERAPVPAYNGALVLAVKPGAQVKVRPGSVAPVIALERDGGHTPLDICPACGTQLEERLDEPFRICLNPNCIGRARARVLHLVGPRGLALKSISVKIADKLLTEHGVLDLADLFGLEPAKLERYGADLTAQFEEEMQRCRKMALWRLLYLAAIPKVGERAGRVIAHHVYSLARLKDLTEAQCFRIPGIDPSAARGLASWLRDEAPRMLHRLERAGLEVIDGSESFAAPFLGRCVAVAGDFERGIGMTADEIERRGGTIQQRVGRTTDLLVVGKNAEPAFDQAAMYKIPVLDEGALNELIKETASRVVSAASVAAPGAT